MINCVEVLNASLIILILNRRHPGKMVSPSFAWRANHLSGISFLSKDKIPDTNPLFQGKALSSDKFRDDV